MNAEIFIDQTVAWLNRRVVRAGTVVDADTPLFDGGLIDSLRILRLIAWTERATGRRIPDEQIRMDHFRTVRTIAAHFVTGRTSAPARRPAPVHVVL